MEPPTNQCSRCGAPLEPSEVQCRSCGYDVRLDVGEGLEEGAVVAGKYELHEQIGAGGMGRVFRAVQQPLGADVCIKTLHDDVTGQPHFEARFLREAKALARLKHPNIVSVLDFGTDPESSTYLVMEYIAGSNLAKITRTEGPMPAPRAVRILGQVCDALTAAHAVGVIHRDLKPSNIMVTDLADQPDFVKVLDFGSALIQGGSQSDRLTHVGHVIGTPVYMAPEYILGRAIDGRVDVYAVGVLLYLLLAGSAPFRGVTQAVFAQHVSQGAEPPRQRNPEADISEVMERVILKALQKDPEVRYHSVTELKGAMVAALEGTFDGADEQEADLDVHLGFADRLHDSPDDTYRELPFIEADDDGPVPTETVRDPIQDLVATAPDVSLSEAFDGEDGQSETLDSVDQGTDTLPGRVPGPPLPVAVVVARGVYELAETVVDRMAVLGETKDAVVETRKSSVTLVFGMVPPLSTPPIDAAVGWSLEAVEREPDRPLRIGIVEGPVLPHDDALDPAHRLHEVEGERGEAEALAATARPGQILVGGSAARAVGVGRRLTPVMPPAGVEGPVFDLKDPTRPDREGEGIPFVGRELQHRALVELGADAGRGRVCLVTGAEGIGKSRLIEEVGVAVSRQGRLWGVARAAPRVRLGPHHALAQVASLGWREAQGCDPHLSEHVHEALVGHPRVAREGLSGLHRQERLVTATLDWLERRRARSPVTVVLDELQYADALTWTLAERIALSGPTLGVSLVLCVRDALSLPIVLPDDTLNIALHPLSAEEVRAMTRLTFDDSLDEATVDLVADKVQGVPLLASEVFAAVRAGQGSLLGRLSGLSPLEAVEELVAARLESVSAAAEKLLCAAALLGHEPSEEELLEVVGPSEESMEALVELEAADLIWRDRSGRARFPFQRVRRVAVQSMSRNARRALHGAAATVVADGADAPTRRLQLGEHLLGAGRYQEAADELIAAAEAAEEDGEVDAAARCLRRALEASRRIGPRHRLTRLQLYRDRGRLLLLLGRYSQADRALKSGLRKARSAGAVEVGADMLRLHGLAAIRDGQVERGLRRLASARKLAGKHGNEAIAARACVDIAETLEARGDDERAEATIEDGLTLVEGSTDNETWNIEVELRKGLARIAERRKDHQGAIYELELAKAIAEEMEDRYQLAGLLGNLGSAHARLGDTARALAITEEALEASAALGDEVGVARQRYNLAFIKLGDGKVDAARELLLEARSAAERSGWRRGASLCVEALGRIGEDH